MTAIQQRWRFAVGLMLFCCSGSILAEDRAHVQPAKIKSFFDGASSSGAERLRPYAASPNARAALPNRSNPSVGQDFTWWMKFVLKPEYVTEDAFVNRHLLLISAKYTNGEEDLAFITYQVAGRTLRLVQTAESWGRGRMWIFVRDPANQKVRSAEDASRRSANLVATFLVKEQRQYVPAFDFQNVSSIYVGDVKASKDPHEPRGIACFVSDQDTCLVVQKARSNSGKAMSDPELNGWFSWYKENIQSADEQNQQGVQQSQRQDGRQRGQAQRD